MHQFGDVSPFLQSHLEVAPATTKKLLELFTDQQKKGVLQIELVAIIDGGENFVKATYNLEGDGPLVFECYEILTALTAGIHTAYYPNLEDVARTLCGGPAVSLQQWIEYGKSCLKPGLDYFHDKFKNDLSTSVEAFKATQLFVPSKTMEMQITVVELDTFEAFPFLNKSSSLHNLKSVLNLYIGKATGVSADVDTWSWWQNHSAELPHRSAAVRDVILVQPSSAAAERIFSLLKASFNPQQDTSLQDFVESSLKLQYNQRK